MTLRLLAPRPQVARTTSARRLILWLCLAIAAILGLGACTGNLESNARPAGIVTEQGWWIDRSQQAELPEVGQVTDWTPFSGLTTFGIGSEPVWFRLRIAAGSEQAPTLSVLRVLPAYLDELTFHDPAARRVVRAGRSVRPEGEMVSSINFSFPLPSMPQARDVYVRLDSATTRLVLIDVLPYGEAAYRNRLHEWLFAALIALSAMSVIWALTEWFVSREVVVGMFALKQCIATVWCLVSAGFARVLIGQALPTGALPAIQSTLLPLTIAAGIAFVAALLHSHGLTRRWTGLMLGLIAGFALLPLLQTVGLTREIRVVTNALLPVVFLYLGLGLGSVVRRRVDPSLPRTMLWAYLCTYGLLLSIPAVINLGGLEVLTAWVAPERRVGVSPAGAPISPWELLAVYAAIFSLTLDGFLMRVLLMRRAHERTQAQRATELKLQRSEEATKARERLNQEQSRLFSMLAHEMKTPLATLRMWTHAGPAGVPAMNRAISEMNLIIERCVHAGQVMEDGLQPIVQEGDALAQTQATIASCRAPERFELTAPDGEAPLTADLQMLSIVLVNLFDNAVKYSAAGTPIAVGLRAQDHDGRPGWGWEIRNAPGPAGMPDPGRLFEKYYRSAGARHQSGSGLGLFLVRGLLDLMGGTIRFDERDGRAVFEIWVPVAPDGR